MMTKKKKYWKIVLFLSIGEGWCCVPIECYLFHHRSNNFRNTLHLKMMFEYFFMLSISLIHEVNVCECNVFYFVCMLKRQISTLLTTMMNPFAKIVK